MNDSVTTSAGGAPAGPGFAAGFYAPGEPLPAGVVPVAFGSLPPVKRALLVIDGTVTTVLEALAGEAIAVTPVGQRPLPLAAADAGLDAAAGEPAIERRVALVGSASGRLYALADSLILPDRLPAPLRAALAAGRLGIGQALRTPGFDSRREGLWFGRCRHPLPPAFADRASGDFLARAYRVLGGGRPVMRITEFFPWELVLP